MDYLKLFDYQTWADEKLFEFLEPLSEREMERVIGQYRSIKDRMGHIVMALEVWYDRLNGFSPESLPDYTIKTSSTIISRWRELNTKLSTFFSSRKTIEFTYQNSKGEYFKNSHEDVAFHVVNHTTAYRSQIVMMIRILGYSVENTDYIYYARS